MGKSWELPVLEGGVHIWQPLLLIEVISNMRAKVEGRAKEYGISQRNRATIIVQEVACRQKIDDLRVQRRVSKNDACS